ncbi:hypothetical protein [Altererythrobacter sp. MTPC7]|uniref:hypothetical protein n=1 Tax=Altererythrobacter sp. MTPC7 TaxID=3056567 RepID=UPI0036F19815
MAWFWWLLLLAGIAALLWAIFDNDDDTPDMLDNDMAEVTTDGPIVEEDDLTLDAPGTDADAADADTDTGAAAAAGGAVTTLAALSSLGDRIGNEVELDTVAVNRVIGDMAFTIGEGDNETLVRFDEVQTPDTAREGLIDVNPGSTVSLAGTVRRLDLSSMPQSVQDDMEGGSDAYIRAARVNVQDGGVNPR